MSRRIAITDDEGNVYGHFRAPDGATADEIEEHRLLYLEEIRTKEAAARETERTTPSSADPICSHCREEVPPKELVAHVKRHAQEYGVDLD